MEFEYSENVETIDLEEVDDFLDDIQTNPPKETCSENKLSPLSPNLNNQERRRTS